MRSACRGVTGEPCKFLFSSGFRLFQEFLSLRKRFWLAEAQIDRPGSFSLQATASYGSMIDTYLMAHRTESSLPATLLRVPIATMQISLHPS